MRSSHARDALLCVPVAWWIDVDARCEGWTHLLDTCEKVERQAEDACRKTFDGARLPRHLDLADLHAKHVAKHAPGRSSIHHPSHLFVVFTSTNRNLPLQQLFQPVFPRLPVFLRRPCSIRKVLEALWKLPTSPTSMLDKFRRKWKVHDQWTSPQNGPISTMSDEETSDVPRIFLVGIESIAARVRFPRVGTFEVDQQAARSCETRRHRFPRPRPPRTGR